jgi:hypothetical protein
MSYLYFIGPIGSDPQFPMKKPILEHVASRFRLAVHFPSISRLPQSVSDIAADMHQATFVLADLSRQRPSCYFELGIASSLKKPIGLIAEIGTEIHQVGDHAAVIFYSNIQEYEKVVTDACAHLGIFAETARSALS